MGSPVNNPHPNDVAAKDPETSQEPEDFFGENGGSAEIEPREPGDDSPIEPGELPEGASVTLGEPVAADELEGVSPEDFAEPADEADEPDAEADDAVEPDEDDDEADDSDEEGETGNKREYVVLQEVVLDQDILNELSKAIKSGEEPMVAMIEVHRARVTNPKSALNAAWRRHKSDWVDPPMLAVVTANKIRARKAKPRVREVIGFEFE